MCGQPQALKQGRSLQDELRKVKEANCALDADRGQLAKHASCLELSTSGLSQQVAALQHETADISDKHRAALARAEEAEKASAVSNGRITALEVERQQLQEQVDGLQAQVSPLLNIAFRFILLHGVVSE
jgi:predicted  nucleic acid-binding Zn-ribbon protein